VRVREAVSPEMIATMRAGMTLAEGEKLAPIEVTLVPYNGTGTVLELVLHQGINRQIRRICRDFGLTVLRLARIAQGPLRLGDLPAGAVRPLSEAELTALRAAANM
jgi:23S rRNA pseudouridine2605 synthase